MKSRTRPSRSVSAIDNQWFLTPFHPFIGLRAIDLRGVEQGRRVRLRAHARRSIDDPLIVGRAEKLICAIGVRDLRHRPPLVVGERFRAAGVGDRGQKAGRPIGNRSRILTDALVNGRAEPEDRRSERLMVGQNAIAQEVSGARLGAAAP
ncbi:MAG TPA: hypothetical protein VMV10_00900, partial [Pirellulales bacterium]|nr:hypothetical protein [Pirellulales bacterium]